MGPRRTRASPEEGTPKTTGGQESLVPKPGLPKPAAGPRGAKKPVTLDLVRRKPGATLARIAKATGWKAHSIRDSQANRASGWA